jgi:DNA-binding response OmpR family regulator
MRVLLAEDDTILADGLCRSLRQAGYAVDWVSSGNQADAALIAQPYDLLILDLGLPAGIASSSSQRCRRFWIDGSGSLE